MPKSMCVQKSTWLGKRRWPRDTHQKKQTVLTQIMEKNIQEAGVGTSPGEHSQNRYPEEDASLCCQGAWASHWHLLCLDSKIAMKFYPWLDPEKSSDSGLGPEAQRSQVLCLRPQLVSADEWRNKAGLFLALLTAASDPQCNRLLQEYSRCCDIYLTRIFAWVWDGRVWFRPVKVKEEWSGVWFTWRFVVTVGEGVQLRDGQNP